MVDNSRILRPRTAQVRREAEQEIQGKATVQTDFRRKNQSQQETTKQETVEEGYFPPGVEPALVRVSAGSTINLGNFESMRLDVSVTLPCRVEEIQETYVRASEYVSDFMAEEEAVWLGPQNSKPAKPKSAKR
jgi:hypothetical protein